MEWKIVGVVAVIIIVIMASSYLSNESETSIEPIGTPYVGPGGNESLEDLECLLENVTLKTVEVWGEAAIKVPAVDDKGKGVTTWLTVDVMPGEGRTLTDINQLLFWIDTQYSIQISKAVAASYTEMNLSSLDIIYAIETEALLVEGPSAGAALTVATVAALYNETLYPDVMVTGTINLDGSIGPVGGIIEKAQAAKDVGATVFLVPDGQSQQTNYRQERKCERMGPITYCTTNYYPEIVDVEEQVGIRIEEVSDISEALKYFIE